MFLAKNFFKHKFVLDQNLGLTKLEFDTEDQVLFIFVLNGFVITVRYPPRAQKGHSIRSNEKSEQDCRSLLPERQTIQI